MEIKKNSIVLAKGSDKVLEVLQIHNEIIICTPIGNDYMKISIPFRREDLSLLIEEETDAFNILFRHDT